MITFNEAVCIIALTLMPLAAQAGGLQFDVPPDGTWARYDMSDKRVDANGTKESTPGTFTISCTGKTTIDDQPCRWVECTNTINAIKDETGAAKDTLKVLIDEEYLKKGEEPMKHIRRAWSKFVHDGRTDIDSLSLNRPPDFNLVNHRLGLFLGGTFETEEKIETKPIDCILGHINCYGIQVGYKDSGFRHDTSTVNNSIWFNSVSPFGVVKILKDVADEKDGKIIYTLNRIYSLAATGVDAKTEIPERN